jgi:type II secretory pathway pseudopilin PulG
MNRGRERGFTVIETMLFLGVSGMLIIGVLVASGGAINSQRYKDATSSLLSFFQSEYDRVANVQNIRESDVTCNAGDTSLSVSGGVSARGTTDCVIIGRLMTPSESGDSITSHTVYASNDFSNVFSESGAQLSGDANAIQNSGLFVDEDLGESRVYRPEWGTRIVRAGSSDPDAWQILIVRSPASGAIRTYVTDDTGMALNTLVSSSHETERLICLDARGLVLTGNRGVVFSAGAAGSSGVKTLGDGQC